MIKFVIDLDMLHFVIAAFRKTETLCMYMLMKGKSKFLLMGFFYCERC